jgi:hypothetical protein
VCPSTVVASPLPSDYFGTVEVVFGSVVVVFGSVVVVVVVVVVGGSTS